MPSSTARAGSTRSTSRSASPAPGSTSSVIERGKSQQDSILARRLIDIGLQPGTRDFEKAVREHQRTGEVPEDPTPSFTAAALPPAKRDTRGFQIAAALGLMDKGLAQAFIAASQNRPV